MIVDFTAYVGHWWPGRELAQGAPERVRRTLEEAGIEAAFVALMEGPWYRDQRPANERLAELVAPHRDFFLPIACLDPTTSYWEEEMAYAIHDLDFAGVRLYPAYHHYFLDNDGVVALAQAAGAWGIPVFLTLMVEEERFSHPAVRTAPLMPPQPRSTVHESNAIMHVSSNVEKRPIPPLLNLLRQAPQTTIIVSLALADEAFAVLSDEELVRERLFFDVARMDKPTLGLDGLVDKMGAAHLVLGTNTPFFYPEGALMNLMYRSFPLSVADSILSANYATNPVLRQALAKRKPPLPTR